MSLTFSQLRELHALTFSQESQRIEGSRIRYRERKPEVAKPKIASTPRRRPIDTTSLITEEFLIDQRLSLRSEICDLHNEIHLLRQQLDVLEQQPQLDHSVPNSVQVISLKQQRISTKLVQLRNTSDKLVAQIQVMATGCSQSALSALSWELKTRREYLNCLKAETTRTERKISKSAELISAGVQKGAQLNEIEKKLRRVRPIHRRLKDAYDQVKDDDSSPNVDIIKELHELEKQLKIAQSIKAEKSQEWMSIMEKHRKELDQFKTGPVIRHPCAPVNTMPPLPTANPRRKMMLQIQHSMVANIGNEKLEVLRAAIANSKELTASQPVIVQALVEAESIQESSAE
jgi:hypothetical protein